MRLVPELARATRLWREIMEARCADPERRNDWFYASDFLQSGSYHTDTEHNMFWTVIAKHPPALEAMKAAGWKPSKQKGWRGLQKGQFVAYQQSAN